MSDNFQSSQNLDKSTLFLDSPLYKDLDVNGGLKTLSNSGALAQAFSVWLVSGVGEKIRTNSGGWLIKFIGREITDSVAEEIKTSIQLGMVNDFTPPITVTNLQVIPDKAKQRWIIHVEGYNEELNIGMNTTTVVDAT